MMLSEHSYHGVVLSWDDERGFGFIEPALGGQEIFFHISVFPRGKGRPQIGERVSFEVELGPQGKKRAKNIMLMRQTARMRRQEKELSIGWTFGTAVIPIFLVVIVYAALYGHMPLWVLLAYIGMSSVCFLVYAFDKSAALKEEWRIKESTLLMLGLLGGWPGAIIAQHYFRHKTKKDSFIIAFWITVFINITVFVILFAIDAPLAKYRL